MDIGGKTRIAGVIGHPISHTLSPCMHNRVYREWGLDYVYVAFDVHPDRLEGAIRSLAALGLVGVNVTVPHKENVIPLLDGLSREAKLIAAVNTIQVMPDGTLTGHNTDAYGFAAAIAHNDGEIKGSRIFLAGAGGAGRAVAFEAALSGAAEITIADAVEKKAAALAGAVREAFPKAEVWALPADPAEWADPLGEADIFVNATPVGMKPDDPPPVDVAALASGAFILDLVYNPPRTRLIELAEKRGLRGVNGLEMLAYQGAKAFQIWTGEEDRTPVQIMLEALRESLGG